MIGPFAPDERILRSPKWRSYKIFEKGGLTRPFKARRLCSVQEIVWAIPREKSKKRPILADRALFCWLAFIRNEAPFRN